MSFRTVTLFVVLACTSTIGCSLHDHAWKHRAASPEPPRLTSAEPAPEPPPPPAPPPPPEAKVEGDRIEIPGEIVFVKGSAAIAPESEDTLRVLLRALGDHAEITKLRIEGHTDDLGGTKLNKSLSQRRADSVRRWLVANGVEKKRLATAGFGASRPLAPNDSDEHRAANRRTEFHVVEIDGKPFDGSR
jgi:outer membrane protein OmpA-like peptidoglycan-associated protein